MTIETINKLYEIEFPHREIVTGKGSPCSEIMLIGEAPGREEVEQGMPFVGKAGKNLSEFLEILCLKREDIFITNAVKFRPTKTSGYGTISNRTPTEAEVRQFLPFLLMEISIINPKIIVTLGNTPLKALLGNDVTIGRLHGAIKNYGGKKLYPLFHPASIIYNPQLKTVYGQDVLNLKKYLSQKSQDIKQDYTVQALA